MMQRTNPAVGHRGDRNTRVLASGHETVEHRLPQRAFRMTRRWAAWMITERSNGRPALISPASATRCPLEALRGESPQYRESCLPSRKRLNRPISARSTQAVTSPIPANPISLDTTGASAVTVRNMRWVAASSTFA